MSNAIQGSCWHCDRSLVATDYGRETNCPGCYKPTRVCRNCSQYSPGRPNDCLEPMAEPILEKERANFCEHFEPAERPAGTSGSRAKSEDLVEAANALFK